MTNRFKRMRQIMKPEIKRTSDFIKEKLKQDNESNVVVIGGNHNISDILSGYFKRFLSKRKFEVKSVEVIDIDGLWDYDLLLLAPKIDDLLPGIHSIFNKLDFYSKITALDLCKAQLSRYLFTLGGYKTPVVIAEIPGATSDLTSDFTFISFILEINEFLKAYACENQGYYYMDLNDYIELHPNVSRMSEQNTSQMMTFSYNII